MPDSLTATPEIISVDVCFVDCYHFERREKLNVPKAWLKRFDKERFKTMIALSLGRQGVILSVKGRGFSYIYDRRGQ